jgi:hypothetical protein
MTRRKADEGFEGPQWDSCSYYDLNYTFIADSFMSYEEARERFPHQAGLPTKTCRKWIYDTSIYDSTVVSEVISDFLDVYHALQISNVSFSNLV